jgi:hypothetical protein
MKCPKCGAPLEFEETGRFSCGTIAWPAQTKIVESKKCLTRQLAAKSAECDEWKLKYELATVKCTCEFADGPTLAGCVDRCVAALSRAEGKDDGRCSSKE